MPSAFDSMFSRDASPDLMAMFGRAITLIANSGSSGTTTYNPTAQVGKEVVRRVKTSDGYKVLRTREVLVSTVATTGTTHLPAVALRTLTRATVDSKSYIVANFDIQPGSVAKLTLERSDPSDITRPNLKQRR